MSKIQRCRGKAHAATVSKPRVLQFASSGEAPRNSRASGTDPTRLGAQRRAGVVRLVQRVRAALDSHDTDADHSDETLADIALSTTRLRIGDIRITLPSCWRQEPKLTNQ